MTRRERIVELVEEHGFQSVASLAGMFDVDASTIRRDLERLAAKGLVMRTHGGAAPFGAMQREPAGSASHLAEKRAIGAAMAQRLHENQTVLLDGGTTCIEVARHLRRMRLTVVTHDLRVGIELAGNPDVNLVFVGGELLPATTSMWGPTSLQQIENLRVNVAIFGAEGVSDDGIYAMSSYQVELKRKMKSIAAQAFFVADSTKFGREALFKVFGFEDFTAGITDDTLDPIRAAACPVPLIRVNAQN
ncbi:DeoR/GlpR family DNA-binding transcription regulator [Pseudarthrobacter sp. NPDC080039]|uniref:DeoR/GlpR family DNA-binding transcription regulator n=1 Tax=unclassified Pseudarthrobacter TaxID=2647000 RepID=UPI00344E55BE